MIKNLKIEGYRCFRHLRVDGLARVNLIVGRNNSGKTSLLDALELLLLREQESAIVRSSWRRQEVQSRGVEKVDSGSELLLDARQLFCGRSIESGVHFSIEAEESDGKTISMRADVATAGKQGPQRSRSPGIRDTVNESLAIKTEGSSRLMSLSGRSLVVSTMFGGTPDQLIRPYVFAGPGTLGARERGRLWDLIVGNEDEDLVTAALRTIEPNIERVIFTVGDSYSSVPAPFVRMKDMSERVPLGNLGHGAGRLLEIALLLVQARGGVFLADEIEIGLHHTVMKEVWHLIVETAMRLDFQVVASTHSQDCIRALADLYGDNRSLVDVVALHRLDAFASKTERFSMDDIEIAEDTRLDLRGLA